MPSGDNEEELTMGESGVALVPVGPTPLAVLAPEFAGDTRVCELDDGRMRMEGEYERADGAFLGEIRSELTSGDNLGSGKWTRYLEVRDISQQTARYRISVAEGHPWDSSRPAPNLGSTRLLSSPESPGGEPIDRTAGEIDPAFEAMALRQAHENTKLYDEAFEDDPGTAVEARIAYEQRPDVPFEQHLNRAVMRTVVEADRTDAAPTPRHRSDPCRLGDLWQLGDHRLLCGDGTDAAQVARVTEGRRDIRCLWTDPPYGVGYVGGTQDARSPNYRMGRPVGKDDLSLQDTTGVVTNALKLAALYALPGAVAYLCSPSGDNLDSFIRAMSRSGFTFHHTLIWVKDSFVFGRTDYHYRHETILYGWLDTGGHYFAMEDRTLSSVFEIARPKRSEEHPTMKPIALVAAMIVNSSQSQDAIYDPFVGSGTTLLAAERLQRRCYGIDIDPLYCDVTIGRWEQLTGRKAVLLDRQQTEDGEETA